MGFTKDLITKQVIEGSFITSDTLSHIKKKKKDDSFEVTLIGSFGEWSGTFKYFDEIADSNTGIITISMIYPIDAKVHIKHKFLSEDTNQGMFEASLERVA